MDKTEIEVLEDFEDFGMEIPSHVKIKNYILSYGKKYDIGVTLIEGKKEHKYLFELSETLKTSIKIKTHDSSNYNVVNLYNDVLKEDFVKLKGQDEIHLMMDIIYMIKYLNHQIKLISNQYELKVDEPTFKRSNTNKNIVRFIAYRHLKIKEHKFDTRKRNISFNCVIDFFMFDMKADVMIQTMGTTKEFRNICSFDLINFLSELFDYSIVEFHAFEPKRCY